MSIRVGLIGYFGWGNFGDELFLDQWMNALPESDPFQVNDLLAKPYFSQPATSVAANADALIIGGGDLIRTEAVSSLYWNSAWTQRPLIVSGIGVARESDRIRPDVVPRLRRFFKTANILSLSARDADSQQWITSNLEPSLPVRLVPDLAFAIDLPGPAAQGIEDRDEAVVVGLVLNKTFLESDLRLVASLTEAHLAGFIRLRIIALATGSQLEQEIVVQKRLGLRLPVETFSSLSGMCQAIASLDLLYSAKFHGLVVAARCGVASISLRNTSKAAALAKSCSITGLYSDEQWDLQEALGAIQRARASAHPDLDDLHTKARAELQHVRQTLRRISRTRDRTS